MSDQKKFEQLLRLLDAESEQVREMVRGELLEFGPRLSEHSSACSFPLTAEQQFALNELMRRYNTRQLRAAWDEWALIENPMTQLETILTHFSCLEEAGRAEKPLGELLDQLAQDFRRTHATPSVPNLNQFLFSSGRIKGARDDYYNPFHSNCAWVIENGRGLPISLACIFMLTADRLGLTVEGFNLPRHFLAMATVNGNLMLFDCFNDGKVLSGQEITALTLMPDIDIHQLISNPPSPVRIAERILRNLINAHSKNGNPEQGQVIHHLWLELRKMPESFFTVRKRISRDPQFRRGQLVRHGRYGYRGVIVDFDNRCLAEESWYKANKTQPEKNQPWYHVLVHGSNVTTYAAQTSLIPDYSGAEVVHPQLSVYFGKFTNGFYLRNDTPWPRG